jgi:hypothetical protein
MIGNIFSLGIDILSGSQTWCLYIDLIKIRQELGQGKLVTIIGIFEITML